MYHIGKNISTASSCAGDSTGIDFGPIIFSICINDLPLSIQNSETDMYADDTTIWLLVIMCEITCIQQSLQEILDNANCWFSLKRMKPNAKKNKENVNWNCSKAFLCRQDMHEFILVSHLESVY